MKIAILAWGSLVVGSSRIADRRQIRGRGPLLPIEFCRISADGRLTLAIDEDFGAICKTYSASSALPSLDAAIENLQAREGMASTRAQSALSNPPPASKAISRCKVIPRLSRRSAPGPFAGYDAAIWTALKSNFGDWGKGGEPFSVSAALQYLETLKGEEPAKFAEARAYIRNAPPEVETPVREEVARRWPQYSPAPASQVIAGDVARPYGRRSLTTPFNARFEGQALS